MEATTATNLGYIEEIQGVVIEALFPDKLPEINHAITVRRASGDEEAEGIASTADELLVCDVQQHRGDTRGRAVAMDPTAGLTGGAQMTDPGGLITVRVAPATLGRIFNVLGE